MYQRLPLLLSMIALAVIPTLAPAQSRDSGGAELGKTTESFIRSLLEPREKLLKTSLLHFLKAVKVDEIKDAAIREMLVNRARIEDLRNDIATSPYDLSGVEDCRDAYDSSVLASAKIGERDGSICFDVPKLAEAFKGLSPSQMTVELAAIALHEHVHHFQSPAKGHSEVARNEGQAYSLSSYVLLTARVLHPPTLEWMPSFKPLAGEEAEINLRRKSCYVATLAWIRAGYHRTKLFGPMEEIRPVERVEAFKRDPLTFEVVERFFSERIEFGENLYELRFKPVAKLSEFLSAHTVQLGMPTYMLQMKCINCGLYEVSLGGWLHPAQFILLNGFRNRVPECEGILEPDISVFQRY